MSGHDYFQIYIDIISDAFRRVRKINFKRFSIIKDLLDTVQNFLTKEVYGRIQPSNYLLAMVVLLGSRTPKVYPPIISAIQRMFSYNFISPNQDLWTSLKLLRQEHKQFLLLPIQDYGTKSFKEIYLQTVMNLGDKDEGLNLSVSKSLSLIWRLDQNSIPLQLMPKIFDYLLDCMVSVRLQEEQKTLKSVFLEMFRHALQSYRQAYDQKFLHNDNCISIKGVVHKYGKTLADKVAIQLDISQRQGIDNYPIVPEQNSLTGFKIIISRQVNQKGAKSGKFGWCTNCRESANYYCNTNRVPVCSFECKQNVVSQIQSLEKFLGEEERSKQMFEDHIIGMFQKFRKYLLIPDGKKRLVFAQIFMLMTSEIKKITDKLSLKAYTQLRGLVRQVIVNIYAQSQAFMPCMNTLRKFMQLRIFVDQTEILLKLFSKKLTYFLTSAHIRDQILKFIRDFVNNRLLFDTAMALDCSPERTDGVKELINALRQLYIGVPLPQTISIPPPEDANARKLSFEICMMLLKYLQETQKKMSKQRAEKLVSQKDKMNRIKNNLQKFNSSEKPLKVTKKLIKQDFFPKNPDELARYVHNNLKQLNSTNIGQLIGDIDEFAGQIRKNFIQQMDFKGHPLDEAMRVMLKKFTLPGQSQVVERIIETFGITYFQQNKGDTAFFNSDAVYAFSYLLMMLQSNLHNPQVVQKMTLPQFAKLSKGMNGTPDAQFPQSFLESIYASVQRKPLGVHEKLKEIELIIAYNASPKKAQQIYLKDLEKQALQALDIIEEVPLQQLPHGHTYPLSIFIDEFVPQIIDILCFKIKDLDDKVERQKDQIVKCLEQIQSAMKLGHQWHVSSIIQRAIQKIWDQIQRGNPNKKILLMEAMFEWTRKFSQHINEQWKVVIFLIGKFSRSKTIRKDQGAKRHVAIMVYDSKVYLLESYVDHLINKTSKLKIDNLISFLKAFLAASREETNQTGSSYCLQKINQVLELNSSRSLEVLTIFWNELRDYYIQLGRHKNQRVALFAADFLKQIVTKFLKRKDLIALQKDYLKPFEQIFLSTKLYPVKELMIGSLSYFVSNHHGNLKLGWKVILSVTSNCFEEDEDKVIKQKAYAILRKIYESGFSILSLEDNYSDFIQILSKLTREKQQMYGLGCLQIIQLIVDYYHQKLGINLGDDDKMDSKEGKQVDIHFWQTVFLPLLSIIFPMCGDCRTKVQSPAIKTLFDILMKYGKLFKYQFWKMVLQGVLRPAFEEITYTSQSKPLKKDQLQKWLNYSFIELFRSINELIVMYYDDFRLFLQDFFKIYQNCILNHSLMLLIELSLKALNQLLEKIAPHFEEHDWETYFCFVQSLLKKTLPIELSSLQSWNRSKDLLENNHEAKCFALQTFLNKMQIIFQKYPKSITQKIYLDVLKELDPMFRFTVEFNENLQLRQNLWKNGFYPDQKFLPGLIRHQYQILSFRSKIYFKLIEFDPNYLNQYFKHFFSVLEGLKGTIQHQFSKQSTLKDYERQRLGMYYRKLVNDVLLGQIITLGAATISKIQMSDKMLKQSLSLMGSRIYCTRCSFCEGCQNSAESWESINQKLIEIITMIYQGK